MTTPAQSSAAAVRAWLADWQHIVLAVACLICATVAAVFVPTERWEKLAHYLSDPATLVTFTAIGGVFVALYRRARGLPPAVALFVALSLGASGCGASALQSQAVASTVAMRVVAATGDVVEAQEGAELAACADVACVDALHARYHEVSVALDSLRLGLLAWGAAIATAAEADAGGDVPSVVLDAARAALGLWPGVVAIAAQLGVSLPPLPAVLVALVGGAS